MFENSLRLVESNVYLIMVAPDCYPHLLHQTSSFTTATLHLPLPSDHLCSTFTPRDRGHSPHITGGPRLRRPQPFPNRGDDAKDRRPQPTPTVHGSRIAGDASINSAIWLHRLADATTF